MPPLTAATAEQRNRFMIDIADEVVIGYAVAGGMLKRVIMEFKKKKVSRIQI